MLDGSYVSYAPCFSSLSHTLYLSPSLKHTHSLTLPHITTLSLSLPPPQEGGRIECGDSHLEEVESLECDSARRRRHAVSPSVKQRWRRARETSTAAGLIRRTRATSSLVSLHPCAASRMEPLAHCVEPSVCVLKCA